MSARRHQQAHLQPPTRRLRTLPIPTGLLKKPMAFCPTLQQPIPGGSIFNHYLAYYLRDYFTDYLAANFADSPNNSLHNYFHNRFYPFSIKTFLIYLNV